jgi:hypothetical protein
MKTTFKIAILTTSLVLMLIADVPLLPEQLVPEADAIMGVRRRTRRRTAVVVGSAVAAQTVATQPAAPAAPAAPAPAPTGKPLPLGSVVSALPGGCTSTPVGGVEYYYCGGNFYRAVFQGNKLVYVTAKPE